jgi:hypothetical protein
VNFGIAGRYNGRFCNSRTRSLYSMVCLFSLAIRRGASIYNGLPVVRLAIAWARHASLYFISRSWFLYPEGPKASHAATMTPACQVMSIRRFPLEEFSSHFILRPIADIKSSYCLTVTSIIPTHSVNGRRSRSGDVLVFSQWHSLADYDTTDHQASSLIRKSITQVVFEHTRC